jgi:hypothetical protein
MKAEEIIRIVELIGSTDDSNLKRLLTDYLSSELGKPSRIEFEYRCRECGQAGVSGYVCPNHRCPHRVTCTA